MSIPDPPWKKRTRPCPFYSQGRCVFADSCGFLHDVKIKSPAAREFSSSTLDAESSPNSTYTMASILKPPVTISVHSPTSSPSSARSPRMSSLLSALQGIIGPPSPHRTEFPATAGDNAPPDASERPPHLDDGMQCAGCVHADDVPVQAVREDVATPAPTCSAYENESASGEDPHRDASSPPLGLLSPVQIGSVPPVPFPHVALGLSTTLSRVDSVDSGYAETWVGPTPFSLSPPQLSQPNSTLDLLLSSPFGSPLSRVLPRRFSPSPTRKHTVSPALRDSIDLVSPPVSTTASPTLPSSPMYLNGISLVCATQILQSPHHASPFGQGGAEDAFLGNGTPGESDPHLGLSSGSPAETLFLLRPTSETPVLKDSAPMVSDENIVDAQLPCGSPSSQRGEGAPSAIEGTVEAPPVSEQSSSVDPSHAVSAVHSPPPSMDTEITTLDVTLPLRSPISLEPTTEIAELDYEALYQSLVMSPEEAASKRMSWASCLSPPTLPRRAASAGSSSAAFSTSALVDVPGRPHSVVDVLPWPRQCDLRVTTVLESESTSHTSSPLPGTPISSTGSHANASSSSVHMSPVPQPEPSHSARSLPTYTSKPADNQWLQSAPISAPLKEVTSTLNNHSESEQTRSKWNRVSTSRKVPFGFRQSLVVDRDLLQAVAPRHRKRPSALTLSTVPLIDQYETPGSTHSSSSESSQSKPSWARPLHLSRPSETGLLIHRLNLHRKCPSSDVNTSTSPSCSQRHSPASSSPHSSHFPQRSHVQNSIHSEHHPSNSPTNDTSQSASLPHTDAWHNSLQPNAESHIYSRPTCPSPEDTGTNNNTPEDEDQLRTFTRAPVPLPTMMLLPSKSSVPSLAPISTTKHEPSLMFAIAGDDAKSVHHALEHGHADPNESMGPQSALAFALTNERLSHKLDIVKLLLAYGADPAALRNPESNPPHRDASAGDDAMLLSPPPTTTLEEMDPAMRYYVSRADAPQTRHVTKLLQHSLFQPLSRVRYEIVGQDQVFEQLFTVLSQHSRRQSASPLVILLCGPSGHGKSFLARRFGSLLGVPTHTVNVTTLRSTHDLWDAYSMSLYEELSTNTLSQFLIENEGKRCVVVLDEIEKVSEPKVLYSLLMPWELGCCSLLADRRHVDVRQVIWLGTSNIGHELIFEFCGSLSGSGTNVTREGYLKLAQLLRPHVSQGLGASLSSRVTTLLPFIPFMETELMAIATEAICSLCEERASFISSDVAERVAREAIECYIPEEGARSLHRAVSSLLTNIDELI